LAAPARCSDELITLITDKEYHPSFRDGHHVHSSQRDALQHNSGHFIAAST